LNSAGETSKIAVVTVDTFKQEIADAVKAYDKFVVCLDKTPEDCEASIVSLMEKAIKAYENRGAQLRHGIALDKQLTIILSQTDTDRPLCGIYFNLYSPYQKKNSTKTAKAAG
jgi:mannitol-1-phosphate/altronate dehydrogenase